MRGLALRLVATRCLDGVKLVRRQRYLDIKSGYGRSGPDWFAYRSKRVQRETIRDRVDLEDALVCRFVNANTDEKRMAFLSRFGLTGDLFGPGPAEPRNFILGEQRVLRALLERAGSGAAGQAIEAANKSLRRAGTDRLSLEPSGRLVWTTQGLMSFMYMEIAIAAANGARLGSCKRCGDVFLYGKGTHRRKTAKWCGQSCKQVSYRANKSKRKGG